MPRKIEDISGRKFNELTAVSFVRSSGAGAMWLFRCDCGSEVVRRRSFVTTGRVKTCGCGMRRTQTKATPIERGGKFGQLAAQKLLGKAGHNLVWECVCDCGAHVDVLASNLVSGNTKSCGCLKRAVTSARMTTHGGTDNVLYATWANMRKRCLNERSPAYSLYGGRGVKVCDSWSDFAVFMADMGPRPSSAHTLDRIDNDGHYSRDNCRWATPIEQANNKRTNILATIGGETKNISQWANLWGVPVDRLYARKRLGWRDAELSSPKHFRKQALGVSDGD